MMTKTFLDNPQLNGSLLWGDLHPASRKILHWAAETEFFDEDDDIWRFTEYPWFETSEAEDEDRLRLSPGFPYQFERTLRSMGSGYEEAIKEWYEAGGEVCTVEYNPYEQEIVILPISPKWSPIGIYFPGAGWNPK